MAIAKTKLNKLKQKGRAIMREQSEKATKAPMIDPDNYKLSLMRALNYYSLEVDEKTKRSYAIAYFKKNGHDVKAIAAAPDYMFSTIGAVAHLALCDSGLNEHDLLRLDNAYSALTAFKKAEEEAVKDKKPTVQDHLMNKARDIIGEFESAIDEFIKNGTDFSAKGHLNGLKAPVIKKIADWFSAKLPELQSAYLGKDKDLNEGYSNLGRRGLKKLIAFIEAIVADCKIGEIATKVARKPRAKKVKPPSVLAKNIKPMIEFPELEMKSVLAEKIVGSSMVVAYNTKTRKLFVYHAADGLELSVAGTKIANWDPVKSFGKTMRKPNEQLKGHKSWGKRNWTTLMNSIRAVAAKPNGRITGDWVLINTF